jgi:signal transduction histidine kinase/ligand-binding sensor domain-containing protein
MRTAGFRVLGVIWTCLVGLLPGAAASGLDSDRVLTELHHTAWLGRDGAPSQITALAQTADGFLWIGSSRGLFRFDGVQFERYAVPSGVHLPSHNIYALLATPDGALWVSFRPSGLGLLKDGRMTVFTRSEELPRSPVYLFARDHDGRIWAGVDEALALHEGSRWRDIGPDWNLPPGRISALFVDREGTLWAAVHDRMSAISTIVFLPRGSKTFRPTGAHVGYVPRIGQAKDGRLWLASDHGARPFPVEGRATDGKDSGIRLNVVELLFDREDNLWLSLDSDGIRRARPPEGSGRLGVRPGGVVLESFRLRDGLSGEAAGPILEDREGDIWIGTTKGLDRFRRSKLVPVSLPPGHQGLALLAGENGEIWAASASDTPLLRVRGEEVIVENAAHNVASVYRDRHRTVWWGARGGVWRQRGDRFDYLPQPGNAARQWIWEIFRGDDEGGLWLGFGDVGLAYLKNGLWTRGDRPDGLLDRAPSASYEDPEGRVWLGYTENRVSALDHGRVRSYSRADGIDIGRIRVIRGRDPRIWFGGELGLAAFRDGRFRTIRTSSGEPFGTVSGIVERADGSLWLNEINGIVHISAKEARAAADEPRHAVRYERFDFFDGLPGAGQMNWNSSTAVEATDGRLWFATDNGLAWIDPARIPMNPAPPPVSIRSITADSRTYEPSGPLDLPPRIASLRIDYTALSLPIPERVRFRYRLEGLEDEWRDAGPRRAAFYTNPGPGSYRFRVAASNNDGVWNETGAAVRFSIAPAFYQTTWFLLLCVAAAACLAWAGYQWRVRQVTAGLDMKFGERLSERTRIARELHDTLLQSFQGLMLHFQKARNLLPLHPAQAVQTLDLALDRADQAITEGRDAIQDIRSAGVLGIDLAEAITALGEELAAREGAQTPAAFRVAVEGTPKALRPILRDEIYGIAREALRNAFRHARASRIETDITYGEQLLRLRIRDNGDGIDPGVLDQGERAGHWGLVGMRERAKRLGLRLEVWSREGAGTEVEVSARGSIAYEASSARSGFRMFRRKAEQNQVRSG